MQKKQAVILTVDTAEVRVMIGERGVNGTFIIKGNEAYPHGGYGEGVFASADAIKEIVGSAVDYTAKITGDRADKFLIGVPGEFSSVCVSDSHIAFDRKKKIETEDLGKLFSSAFIPKPKGTTLVNTAAVVYELDDLRMLVNPIGATSEILKGKLSFTLASDYFLGVMKAAFASKGKENVSFVSVPLAEAMYLFDARTRDRIAVLLEVCGMSTTFSIIQGDGILYQKTESIGNFVYEYDICNEFDVSRSTVDKLLRSVNLCTADISGVYEVTEGGKTFTFPKKRINEIICENIDVICEFVYKCIEDSGYILPDYVPITLTGGGIDGIRGVKETLASGTGMQVEVVAPKLPMMDKTDMSAALSVLDFALGRL